MFARQSCSRNPFAGSLAVQAVPHGLHRRCRRCGGATILERANRLARDGSQSRPPRIRLLQLAPHSSQRFVHNTGSYPSAATKCSAIRLPRLLKRCAATLQRFTVPTKNGAVTISTDGKNMLDIQCDASMVPYRQALHLRRYTIGRRRQCDMFQSNVASVTASSSLHTAPSASKVAICASANVSRNIPISLSYSCCSVASRTASKAKSCAFT